MSLRVDRSPSGGALLKMTTNLSPITAVALTLSLLSVSGSAQDQRTQYPFLLSNSYLVVDIGYVDYPFSGLQVEPGYHAESIHIPHLAVRLILLGHRFNKYLSAQISYMRPVLWVRYRNVNGIPSNRSVWMNLAGVTVRSTAPVKGPLSIHGECGLGMVTRSGFRIDDTPVVKDAHYSTILLGAGLQYRLTNTWDAGVSSTYSPANPAVKQPHTVLFSGGLIFNMRPLPLERVRDNLQSGFIFPRNLVQVGYATSEFGLGANDFVSKGAVPIFWSGSAVARRGASLHYQRNVFHGRRVFSLDCGASVAHWTSARDRKTFYTASVFPLLRFTALRLRPADLYFDYSLAGPTLISRVVIDGFDTGRHFTFQDFLGVGVYLGKKRNINAEIRIGHYSNGNLFPQNAGVEIPLTFNVGRTF